MFTFGLLAVYRLGSHIPTPGVDPVALSEFFKAMQGGVFGFLDLFSGGALLRLDHSPAPHGRLAVPREALEGRGDGAAEDQPVHALRHHRAVDRSVARR